MGMKRVLFLIFLIVVAISCRKKIGDTQYYLDSENFTIENDYVDWSVIKNPGYGIMGAYYNDDYIFTFKTNPSGFVLEYYIIKIDHRIRGNDHWMKFSYKEDFLKARDSLGLDERKMTLIKW